MTQPAANTVSQDPGAPKRRGRGRRRHTVGMVMLASALVLALLTGLLVVYLYRDLNGNLDVLDIEDQLGERPEKEQVAGPQEPLNILVMGSDTRAGVGNNIDNLTGGGERSDTTILFHLSADRERAYGVSIPRDTLVTRPECTTEGGETVPGGTDVLWNEAFNLAGPACTIKQFEELTGVFIDHFVVVDFAGFQDMVDAIDGVEVCIPEDIVDPAHGINIPAGTREIEGKEALNYVRARYTLGDGSDIGRIARQQAFIASMVNKVFSANVLARIDRLVGFLRAATKSLTVDPGLGKINKIAGVGLQFRNIGLSKIQFLTVPFEYDTREEFRGRVVWLPQASLLWRRIAADEPLTPALTDEAISAAKPPGAKDPKDPSDSASPSTEPSSGPSPDSQAEVEDAQAKGLCA